MKMTYEQRAEQIRDIVTEHFLVTNEALDARQIATEAGVSESAIRRTIARTHGAVPGTFPQRTSRERSGFSGGYTSVWVYEPSLRHLAKLVMEARTKLEAS